MYGLLQAGSLGLNLLDKKLNKEGYFWSKILPDLWKHRDKSCLLLMVLTSNRSRKNILTTPNTWGNVMFWSTWSKMNVWTAVWIGPINATLTCQSIVTIQYLPPSKPQNSPHQQIPLTQYAEVNNSPPTGKDAQTYIQQVNSKFL